MKLLRITFCAALASLALAAYAGDRLPGYLQAEKFTKEKLNTMLFSTRLSPQWMENGSTRDSLTGNYAAAGVGIYCAGGVTYLACLLVS